MKRGTWTYLIEYEQGNNHVTTRPFQAGAQETKLGITVQKRTEQTPFQFTIARRACCSRCCHVLLVLACLLIHFGHCHAQPDLAYFDVGVEDELNLKLSMPGHCQRLCS